MEKFVPVMQFLTKDEEIMYWKNMAYKLYERQEEMKCELEEYQEHSIIIEKELETSYEQTVEKNRELKLLNNRLRQDNEDLRVKLNEQVNVCFELDCKSDELKNTVHGMSERIRKLEQDNDDLERANRELKVSAEALEEKFNDVIEKVALLETEVEEKEGLKIIIQRLRDEIKDLKEQIEVDLRKTQGSPLSRIRRMSMVTRTYRHSSAEGEKNLPVNEKIPPFKFNNEEYFFQYLFELEKENQLLKHQQEQKSSSKVVVVDMATKSNTTYSSCQFYAPRPDEMAVGGVSNSDEDEALEAQVTIRTSTGQVSVERGSRPLSAQSLTNDRAARVLQNRVKKAKDEDKNQTIMHFLKRFRYRQPSWMRKKH